MEFQTSTTFSPPKNLYPCLATITVVPHGTDTRSRRLSGASFGSNGGGGSAVADDDGGALKRVMSGGRRKTSFGVVADRGDLADVRRKSFSGATGGGDEAGGKWYWRVQAGAADNHIVLLPLTQPPNPVLTSPPQPLSHAMPAHSTIAGTRTGAAGQSHDQTGTGHEEEHQGIGTKIKNLFRRPSTMPHDYAPAGAGHAGEAAGQPTGVADKSGNGNDTMSQATATTATAVDRVIDQTPQGDMLPSSHGNAVGATNLNANAETGWPGVIQGQHLAGIVVDLHSVDKSRVTLGGGKKNEGSTVTIHVSSIGHPGIERVGVNHHESPKSGTIKFEFDKDWIGAKGEAELLHHYITSALENLPDRVEGNTAGGGLSGDRPFPQAENFQLGGGQNHVVGGGAGVGHANVPSANVALGREVAPDERAL